MGDFTHFSKIAGVNGLYEGTYGEEVRVYGVQMGDGTRFYVDSVNGSASNTGLSWDTALITIDAAINKCTANAGDIIYVAAGHVESIVGTSITADIAGITIIGLGKGSRQAQVTYDLAAAEISIAADNVTISGLRLSASVPDTLVGIEIEDGIDYAAIVGNTFDVVTTGTDEFAVCVRTNDASNFALVEDNDIDMGLGNAVAAVSFTKDTNGTVVRNNRIQGDFSTANIQGITTASTKVLIENNLLVNGGAKALNTEPCIQLLTNSTGVIRDNDVVTNLATMVAAVVADGCMLFRNYYNEDVQGTGTILGTASADG